MKASAVFSTALRFLAERILSPQGLVAERPRPADASAAALPAAVIRCAGEILEAHAGQPVIVTLGPTLAFLTMLRRRPRRNRPHWQSSGLPPGCVMLVRYRSREGS